MGGNIWQYLGCLHISRREGNVPNVTTDLSVF